MTGAVAIVPARENSKRLSRKNLLPFAGKPMLTWTLEAATISGLFDEIILTTEDPEIAKIGLESGVMVVDRPTELSADEVPLIPVALHAIDQLEQDPPSFCLLMPNCPLRTSADIIKAHSILVESRGKGVMSVVRYGWRPPEWALFFSKGWLKPVPCKAELESLSKSSSGLFCPSGAIRWVNTVFFREQRRFYFEHLVGYEMPWYRAVDIDTQEDFEVASCIAHAIAHGFSFSEI